MRTGHFIRRATTQDASQVAEMVGELLAEIMKATGIQAFNFDLPTTIHRLVDFLDQEKYFVFVAWDGAAPVGFIAIHESHALYAGGAFGTIPEFYVRLPHRSRQLGFQLLSQAKAFGRSRNWTRLEVTTPPLPHFDKTLAFYEREGFSISGGRKLRVSL